jgi:hypothetical protein
MAADRCAGTREPVPERVDEEHATAQQSGSVRKVVAIDGRRAAHRNELERESMRVISVPSNIFVAAPLGGSARRRAAKKSARARGRALQIQRHHELAHRQHGPVQRAPSRASNSGARAQRARGDVEPLGCEERDDVGGKLAGRQPESAPPRAHARMSLTHGHARGARARRT